MLKITVCTFKERHDISWQWEQVVVNLLAKIFENFLHWLCELYLVDWRTGYCPVSVLVLIHYDIKVVSLL